MKTFYPTFRLLITLIAINLLTTQATAQTKNWIGNTGNWSDPNGWMPVGVPAATDDVIIDATDNVAVPAAYNAVAKSISISGSGILSTNTTSLLEIDGSSFDGILVAGSGSQFTNNGLIKIGNKSAI